jgi:hypothetical protein
MANLPEGTGAIRTMTAPPVAVDLFQQLVVPDRTRIRILAISALLTTTAIAGTRMPYIDIQSQLPSEMMIPDTLGQAASLVHSYKFMAGWNLPSFLLDTFHCNCLPYPIEIHSGAVVTWGARFPQAGDHFQSLRALILEWIDP